MDAIQSAIARARFRLLMQGALHWLGWLLLGAVGVAALMVVADRQRWIDMPWWAYAILGGAAVLAAPIVAWLRRPSDAAIAARLDDRLGLKDRLGTALFAASLQDSPFAHQVVHDAQQAAQHLRTRSALPVRLGRIWAFVPPALGMWIALVMLLDPAPLHSAQAEERQAQREAEANEARERIIEAKSMVKDASPQGRKPDEAADPDQIDEQLANILQQDLRNPDVRREVRPMLSRMREQLEKAGQAKQEEYETVRNALSQLDTQQYGPADEFTKALRRGDFEDASDELEQIKQQVRAGEMNASDRRRLANQLRDLSNQLNQASKQDDQGEQSPQQQKAAQQTKSLSNSMQQMAEALAPQQQSQPQNQQQQHQKQQSQNQQQQQKQNPSQQQSSPQQASQQQNSQQQSSQQQSSKSQQSKQAQQSQQGNSQQSKQAQQTQQGQQSQQGSPTQQSQQAQQSSPSQQSQQAQKQQQSQQAQQSQSGAGQQQQQSQSAQQQSQQPGESQSQSNSQFTQRTWQTQQQLDQMSGMKRQTQRMNQAQQKMQQAMQRMGGGAKPGQQGGQQPGQQPGQQAGQQAGNQSGNQAGAQPGGQQGAGNQPGAQPGSQGPQPGAGQGQSTVARQGGQSNQGGSRGGLEAGSQAAGNPLGGQRQAGNYQTHAAADIQYGQGRVIASWLEEGGEMSKGEPSVEFDRAITEARDQAERAVSDDRVPRQYHGSIKAYFDQLKASARDARSSPPESE